MSEPSLFDWHLVVVESVHIWGFYDADDAPQKPTGVEPSSLSVHDHHRTVEANVIRFGSTIEQLRTTRTLDGWLVGTEFDSGQRDDADRMWHQIVRPQRDTWVQT